MKRCTSCGVERPFIEFYRHKNTPDTYSWECKDCHKEFSRKSLLSRYGLTVEQFDYLLEKQDNRCAICQTLFTLINGPKIDHDHTCCPSNNGNSMLNKCGGKCVRGLLCNNCNVGLGMFKDDYERVVSAANYLKSYLGIEYPTEILSLEEIEGVYYI